MALKSFLILEEDILQDKHLKMAEKLVLAYCRGFWRCGDVCISSNNTISKYLNISRVSVVNAIKSLEANCYISIRYEKPNIPEMSKNVIRFLEKPRVPKAEQLSLLFKRAISSKK